MCRLKNTNPRNHQFRNSNNETPRISSSDSQNDFDIAEFDIKAGESKYDEVKLKFRAQ
jgi:hypothetical protein